MSWVHHLCSAILPRKFRNINYNLYFVNYFHEL
nr:MAG TPA: hypothetical protein [Caudoviricetes sp.]